ncbi:5814_t:CDS:2 [Paraglomus brasilianum]|uniref:5814_t:CDS:1 n=1 Tax=Paraglomus brasilianum TaxID=144538 RepID=A0A9N9CWT8_9GLOM|nr:5814_t:CDS:2 [Paraglomus brasilianum]
MAMLQPRIILGFPDLNNVGCKLLDKIRTKNESELEVANGKVRVRNVGDTSVVYVPSLESQSKTTTLISSLISLLSASKVQEITILANVNTNLIDEKVYSINVNDAEINPVIRSHILNVLITLLKVEGIPTTCLLFPGKRVSGRDRFPHEVKIIKALADTLGGLIIDIDIDIDETINEADNDEAVTETPDHMMYM